MGRVDRIAGRVDDVVAGGKGGQMPGQYPARVSDHGFWAVQSLVTEPGPAAVAIDRLPPDLGVLRAASQQLVFHYWADGDWAENGIAPERNHVPAVVDVSAVARAAR